MIKNKNGFTLIELLIVVAILGIIVGIAVPTYFGQQRKAAMTEATSNLQQIRLLEEQFFAENGRYTPDADNSIATSEAAFYDVARDPDPPAATPVNSIVAFLRGFRPGRARDLNYDYRIVCPDNMNPPAAIGGITPPSFLAIATPKAGTVVGGTAPLWINDRNQNNF